MKNHHRCSEPSKSERGGGGEKQLAHFLGGSVGKLGFKTGKQPEQFSFGTLLTDAKPGYLGLSVLRLCIGAIKISWTIGNF